MFIRAMTYFALVKRYGGVPLLIKYLPKPGETIDDIVTEKSNLKYHVHLSRLFTISQLQTLTMLY